MRRADTHSGKNIAPTMRAQQEINNSNNGDGENGIVSAWAAGSDAQQAGAAATQQPTRSGLSSWSASPGWWARRAQFCQKA